MKMISPSDAHATGSLNVLDAGFEKGMVRDD